MEMEAQVEVINIRKIKIDFINQSVNQSTDQSIKNFVAGLTRPVKKQSTLSFHYYYYYYYYYYK